MRFLITLLLGFGAVSMAACKSADTAEVKSTQTVMVDVTGMT
jgi:hypothetical protein